MRSKSDPISMLKDRMLSNNMASVEEFKVSADGKWRLHRTALEEPNSCLSVLFLSRKLTW